MVATPTVRQAGPDDVAALVRLILAFRDFLGAERPSATAAALAVREIQSDGRGEFALAFLAGSVEPVGYSQLLILPSVWAEGREAYLEDLFVHESAWRSGVGSALLEHAFARARRAGASVIALTSNEHNERAQAFYVAHGFRAAGEARYHGGREVRFARGLTGR